MKFQKSLLLATLLVSSGSVFAQAASVSGTAVINGNTVTFTQGRAWKAGGNSPVGPPYIEFMIAEKSLAGLDALARQADFTTGKRGRVFHVSPHALPSSPPYKYDIDEDTGIQLWANDFGLGAGEDWQGIPLSKAKLVTTDIKVVDNSVQGTLEWKGEQTQNHMSDANEDKLTAFKLTFKLPLEDDLPGRKK